MFSFVQTCIALVDEFLWWCTLFRLRRKAREAADEYDTIKPDLEPRSYHLGGVCALDQLPRKIIRRPKMYIVDTQERYRPGKHWLVLYLPKVGPSEFFDSAGHGHRYYSWRFERFEETRWLLRS